MIVLDAFSLSRNSSQIPGPIRMKLGSLSTKTDCFWPIWTLTHQHGPLLANLDPDPPKRTVFGQFGSLSTKTDRFWPIWTLNHQNGPLLANLDPEPPKWAVFGQFGP